MSPSSEALVRQIERLGLMASEAKAYLALVKSGPCTALQVAHKSGLQRTEVYTLMPTLIKLGLIEETVDRPRRYRAVDPRIGLFNLTKHSAKEAQNITTTARQLASVLKSLEGKSTLEAKPEVRILSGVGRLRALFYELVNSAQEEVWMMSGSRPILGTSKSGIAAFLRIVSSRHLRARLIAELDPVTADSLKQIPLIEIRHCQELHSGLFGVDERVAAFGLSSSTKKNPEQATYLVLTHPESVKSIRSFYEAFWDNTIPFEAWVASKEKALDKGRTGALIWGRERLYAVVADWHLKAKKWILDYMPHENGPARFCAYYKDGIIKARNQGTKTQSLCHITPENLAAVKELCRFTEVRHTEVSPLIGLAILDESEAVIQHIQSDTPTIKCSSDMSVHITDQDAVRRLVELFNLLWEHSTLAEDKIRELAERQIKDA